MSFISLDITHARSNITMADCKKKGSLSPEVVMLMEGAYPGARPQLGQT